MSKNIEKREDEGGLKLSAALVYNTLINGFPNPTEDLFGGKVGVKFGAGGLKVKSQLLYLINNNGENENLMNASVSYNLNLLILKINVGAIGYVTDLNDDLNLFTGFTGGISIIGLSLKYFSKISGDNFKYNELARLEASYKLFGFKIRGNYFFFDEDEDDGNHLLFSLSYKLSVLLVNIIPTVSFDDNEFIFSASITL